MPGNQHPNQERLPSEQRSSGGAIRALLLTIAVLLLVYAALSLDVLPGATSGNDLPEVMAAGGCFDIEVKPVDEEPPISLPDVEEEVRTFLTEFDEEHGLPHKLGRLRLAEYGEVTAGGYTGHPSPGVGRVRWVLVFDLEPPDWWSRLFGREQPNRRTALYATEAETVSSACSGLV